MKAKELLFGLGILAGSQACDASSLRVNACVKNAKEDISGKVAVILYEEPSIFPNGDIEIRFDIPDSFYDSFDDDALREDMNFIYKYKAKVGTLNYVEINEDLFALEINGLNYQVGDKLFVYLNTDECGTSHGFLNCIDIPEDECGKTYHHGVYWGEGLPLHEIVRD